MTVDLVLFVAIMVVTSFVGAYLGVGLAYSRIRRLILSDMSPLSGDDVELAAAITPVGEPVKLETVAAVRPSADKRKASW